MFDLPSTRYIEGAPMEWRRWLTPGTPVVLRFEDAGICVFGVEKRRERMLWAEIASIDVRGPDEAEYPPGTRPPVPIGGNPVVGVLSILVLLYLQAKDRLPKKVEFSWLAFTLHDETEMIFEVYGALHDRLEAFLEQHAS